MAASSYGRRIAHGAFLIGCFSPRADTPAMSVFLTEFAKTLPENEHALMVLD